MTTAADRDALIAPNAWIEHWQADVALGLKPTPESLEAAKEITCKSLADQECV